MSELPGTELPISGFDLYKADLIAGLDEDVFKMFCDECVYIQPKVTFEAKWECYMGLITEPLECVRARVI